MLLNEISYHPGWTYTSDRFAVLGYNSSTCLKAVDQAILQFSILS